MKSEDRGVLTRFQAETSWDKLINRMYPAGVDTIWAVESMDDGHFVGDASVRPRPIEPEDWEIAYYLNKTDWRKGYATEIVQRLARYTFAHRRLPAVYATVDPRNSASLSVLRKAGFSLHAEESDDLGPYLVYRLRPHELVELSPSSEAQ